MIVTVSNSRTAFRRTTAVVLTSVALAAGPLAGCGGDDSIATSAPSTTPSGSGAAHGGGGAPVGADSRHIQVTARSFAFEPKQITVKPGESIAVVLNAQEGQHHFKVDDFNADVSAAAGKTGFGGFRAGGPGRYTFYCSMSGHREAGMEGSLVVEA